MYGRTGCSAAFFEMGMFGFMWSKGLYEYWSCSRALPQKRLEQKGGLCIASCSICLSLNSNIAAKKTNILGNVSEAVIITL